MGSKTQTLKSPTSRCQRTTSSSGQTSKSPRKSRKWTQRKIKNWTRLKTSLKRLLDRTPTNIDPVCPPFLDSRLCSGIKLRLFNLLLEKLVSIALICDVYLI